MAGGNSMSENPEVGKVLLYVRGTEKSAVWHMYILICIIQGGC